MKVVYLALDEKGGARHPGDAAAAVTEGGEGSDVIASLRNKHSIAELCRKEKRAQTMRAQGQGVQYIPIYEVRGGGEFGDHPLVEQSPRAIGPFAAGSVRNLVLEPRAVYELQRLKRHVPASPSCPRRRLTWTMSD